MGQAEGPRILKEVNYEWGHARGLIVDRQGLATSIESMMVRGARNMKYKALRPSFLGLDLTGTQGAFPPPWIRSCPRHRSRIGFLGPDHVTHAPKGEDWIQGSDTGVAMV